MEKTIIITGGSKGLGFQTACFIAKDQQISLVIANRNLKKNGISHCSNQEIYR